jgi:diguanylate cyclase
MNISTAGYITPVAAMLRRAGLELGPHALKARAGQRRQVQAMNAVSYVFDVLLLELYACAGTIPTTTGLAFGACGGFAIACYLVSSETGFNERFKDHHLAAVQVAVHMIIMLTFVYLVPEVGVTFLCSMIVAFNLGSFRLAPGPAEALKVIVVLATITVFLRADGPITLPHGSAEEKLVSALLFALTIIRCMSHGRFSIELRESLYRSKQNLTKAYRRIQELAEIDELTGAFNRRSIMRMLKEEISRSERNDTPCSIALIDLDWFKRINDTYGHPVGDEVLGTFAIAAFANVRAIDRFGRYGGEEFLLLLPGTPQDKAVILLDRVRTIVAELNWDAFSSGLQVTVSAGVAALRPGETAESLLARADSALYGAKANGRNRVAIPA